MHHKFSMVLPICAEDIMQILEIMKQLRNPQTGCPWDVKQNFASIAPYTLEEAYEVVEAIHRNDMENLREELGDLLLQVVFHAQIAAEEGHFTFSDVEAGICEKMTRRHPHVFADAHGTRLSPQDAKAQWATLKAQEKAVAVHSALDSAKHRAPALTHALHLQKAAATTGFDWDAPEPILEKLIEEAAEFIEAAHAQNRPHMEDEFGDLLFTLVNIGRSYGLDPETALANANTKFTTRFQAMEAMAAREGHNFADLNLDAQEALWQRVKQNACDTANL